MAITYAPKVGELLECHYGEFPEGTNLNFNNRIPPEIVKKRMVVVLNGKICRNSVIVVPISSSKDVGKIREQLHIAIDQNLIQETHFYDRRERWAKSEIIQHVSKVRLFKIKDSNGQQLTQYLPREVVAEIQRAVIKAISAKSLLAAQPKVEE